MHRVLAAIVGLLMVGDAVAVATVRDTPSHVHATAATTTTSVAPAATTASSATTSTSRPPQIDPFLAEVRRLEAFVEAHRGLRFTTPVTPKLITQDEMRRRIADQAKNSDDQLVKEGKVLEALGLVPRGTDMRKARDALLGSAVLGYYDPETKELVVRGTSTTPYVRATLAHELTHALQDQAFGINHPEYDKADDERATAYSALVEGDAVRIEQEYVDALSSSDRRKYASEEASASGGVTSTGALYDLLVFPYLYGPTLIKVLLAAGGQARLDAAFKAPPTTSEQVMHPSRFLAGEAPKAVADPPADGPVIDKGAVGEYVLRLLLAKAVSDSDVDTDADGWGGDRYVAWSNGDGACIRIALTMDTAKDQAEVRDGLSKWVAHQPHATLTGSDPLTVTACG